MNVLCKEPKKKTTFKIEFFFYEEFKIEFLKFLFRHELWSLWRAKIENAITNKTVSLDRCCFYYHPTKQTTWIC